MQVGACTADRVLYVNFMGFLWTVILCCVARKIAAKPHPKSNQGSNNQVQTRRLKLQQSGRSSSDYTSNYHREQDLLQPQSPADALHHRSFAALQVGKSLLGCPGTADAQQCFACFAQH